jgi:hypothetical protein
MRQRRVDREWVRIPLQNLAGFLTVSGTFLDEYKFQQQSSAPTIICYRGLK